MTEQPGIYSIRVTGKKSLCLPLVQWTHVIFFEIWVLLRIKFRASGKRFAALVGLRGRHLAPNVEPLVIFQEMEQK